MHRNFQARAYRLGGHLYDDPQYYRSREEGEEKWQSCPIKRFKALLKSERVLSDEEIDRLEREMVQQADKAVAFARESPYPEPDEAFKDIFREEG